MPLIKARPNRVHVRRHIADGSAAVPLVDFVIGGAVRITRRDRVRCKYREGRVDVGPGHHVPDGRATLGRRQGSPLRSDRGAASALTAPSTPPRLAPTRWPARLAVCLLARSPLDHETDHKSGLDHGNDDDATNVGTGHHQRSMPSTIWLTFRSAASRAAVSEATIKREARQDAFGAHGSSVGCTCVSALSTPASTCAGVLEHSE